MARRTDREPKWARWSDEELLDVRLCDLGVRIAGTKLEARVERVYGELARRGVTLRPHVWLANDWFSPDGIPGFGIPFYLAHPRLMQLEKTMLFEVEGGTESWCMKILRHEMAHAVCNGYRLHYRKSWRETFGRFSEPYPTYYRPKPMSRDFVLHLDWWYAQAHPAEDFAETFAVWLKPGSRWRQTYKGWPALKKLQRLDEMMKTVAGKTAPVRSRQHVNSIRQLNTTLRAHYEHRHEQYTDDAGDLYDRDLLRLFSGDTRYRENPTAAQFLWRNKRKIREAVSEWASVHPYSVDRVILDLIARSKKLQLRLTQSEDETRTAALLMVAVQTMYLVRGGKRLVAL